MKQMLDLTKYFTNQMFLNDEIYDEVMDKNEFPEYLGVDFCTFRYARRAFALMTKTPFEIKYMTEKTSSFEKDVIRCDGQNIQVPPNKYTKISFLGGCVWDYFCEYVILHYEDGTEERKQIFLYSFSEPNAKDYVEFALNNCPCKDCKDVLPVLNRDMVGLTVYQFDLCVQSAEKIVSIILPENENMCIFAITLT